MFFPFKAQSFNCGQENFLCGYDIIQMVIEEDEAEEVSVQGSLWAHINATFSLQTHLLMTRLEQTLVAYLVSLLHRMNCLKQ